MSGVSPEAARAALAEHLSPSAFHHSEAVAETARDLASTYGVDSDLAYLAGLLHDWAREDSAQKILEDARRAGMELDPVEEEVPYLLHARTGAHALRSVFPDLPEEVISAVAKHTLGDEDMSDLDKVLYIADMIEPSRSYKGVKKLRAAVGEVGLDELFARAYAHSLKHVIKKRKHLHPVTVRTWNSIVSETSGKGAA